MIYHRSHLLLFLFFLFLFANRVVGSEKSISFNRDVRSILSDKCYKCHGPDAKNQKSAFRLDSFEEATRDHGDYKGIEPGDPKNSELHWRVTSTDPIDMMPPPESKITLTEEEIAILNRWIEQGAPYEKHWSLQMLPDTIAVPESAPAISNPIDAFIHRKLTEQQLTFSPPASREKWLRRVTFDLTGLPPTLQELDRFQEDQTPDAYEKVVDRLLNSEAYAERMTSEWLDVARYSDTYGYQVDRNREVWPWRDWVIRAFQKNLPYDQFMTWQIAGDLMPNATKDQILATTFNRLHPQKVEGGSVEEEFRMEYVSDRVHTFGTAFLGLTMECTRCHDHKYDPLTQLDYFSLSAFFANIDESGLYSFFTNSVPTPTLELPTEAQSASLDQAEKKITSLLQQLEAEKEKAKGEFAAWKTSKPDLKFSPEGQIVHVSFDENEKNQYPNLVDEKSPAKSTPNNKAVAGKIGMAVQLTGDDAINFPKGVGNFSRDQPFSISLWLQLPSHYDRAVICRRSKAWTDAASRGYELLIEEGKLSAALIHFWPGNAIRISTADTLPLNEWTHVSLRYDGSSSAAGLRLYLNGKAAATQIDQDQLNREILGGGDDFFGIGQRMRDKGFKQGMVDDLRVFDREISDWEIAYLANPETKSNAANDHVLFEHFLLTQHQGSKDIREKLEAARTERSKIQKGIKEIMVMRDIKGPARKSYILNRGAYDQRGEEVKPNTPAVLPPLAKASSANRLDLAQWLTHPDHPLSARVAVNRYWQNLFGRGLVSTSEDFGSQGNPPTHPELLDWLARDFVSHGWDLHHFFRQIVLSKTYRQASKLSSDLRERDPENLWLARSPSYKLPAEMIRDNALAVSGLLSSKIGGPSVKPYDLEVSFKPIKPDSGENLYRRSVYTFWKQTGPSPLMMTLDASKREVCRVKREETASPLQSLVLLNSPQFMEAARSAAETLVSNHGGDDIQLVETAFRMFTSRVPDESETKILLSLLEEQRDVFSKTDDAKLESFLKIGNHKTEKSNVAKSEIAATAMLVSALMNFDESITKR